MIKITEKDGGVIFAVRVQPRASRSEIVGELDGALKLRLAAPPVDGEANEELIRFLAKLFDVSRQRVFIAAGQTSKNKLMRIENVAAGKAETILRQALGN